MNLCQAADVLGLKQQRLTEWIHRDLVRPKGYRNRHGAEVDIGDKELREFRSVRDLRRAGLSLQAIRKVAGTLRRMGKNPF